MRWFSSPPTDDKVLENTDKILANNFRAAVKDYNRALQACRSAKLSVSVRAHYGDHSEYISDRRLEVANISRHHSEMY